MADEIGQVFGGRDAQENYVGKEGMIRALKDYGMNPGTASAVMLGIGYAQLLMEGALGMEMGALGSETMQIGLAEGLGTTSDVMDVGTEFVENGWREGLKNPEKRYLLECCEHYAKKQIKKNGC